MTIPLSSALGGHFSMPTRLSLCRYRPGHEVGSTLRSSRTSPHAQRRPSSKDSSKRPRSGSKKSLRTTARSSRTGLEYMWNGSPQDIPIKPNHPQTNGMLERFNGKVEVVVSQSRFPSSQ